MASKCYRRLRFAALLVAIATLICTVIQPKAADAGDAEAEGRVVLLEDDFTAYRSGLISSVVDAFAEYHYLPEVRRTGPWEVTTFRSTIGSQRAWRIMSDDEGRRVLAQRFENKKERHTHPMVAAGDLLWTDYSLEVEWAAESSARSGAVVRYRNDRCYYFAGVEAGRAVLKMVQHERAYRQPHEMTLADAPFDFTLGEYLRANIEVMGDAIIVELARNADSGSGVRLTARDPTYPTGKIGLLADGPSRYRRVRVTGSAEMQRQTGLLNSQRAAEESQLQASLPKPKLWKKIKTEEFGVGRNLRFGDLDGDGQLDVLIGQMRHHGPKDRNSELSCLTAVTLEGKRLWQTGDPDPWKYKLTNDVAFQIHDLDGDGKSEVIYVMNMELTVADGATGAVIRKVPTPQTPPTVEPPYDRFPRVLGDALLLADFRGVGRATDLVLKDRYKHFWVFNERLEPTWNGQCNTGHYPFPCDLDGDGREELLVGYSLYDDDGKQLWTLDKEVQDHADGIGAAQLSGDGTGPFRVLCAASDEGMFFTDAQGKILRHHRVGHAQNPTIANFRDDLPGLESLSLSFWGNQGIIHLYDSRGEVYHDFEPCQHGSPCLPVNWSGRSEELFMLTANVEDGGLFDGLGRRAVRMPDDGHPEMCFAVLDMTGDCRDELVVWDPYELWVYTQDDNPRTGRLYKPRRNPLYNYSNYMMAISQPGWSE